MKRALVTAVGVLLMILPSCRPSEAIPETALDRENPEGVDHNSWTPAYTDDDLYTWLFAQTRADR